jgi:LuxR family maltose regulon positive regulatory protein
LFAEMLLSQLRRREPGEEFQLRRRAVAWYEEHAMPEQAIGHALACHATPVAARLVNTYGQHFVNAGRIDVVRGWLEALDGALENYPPVAVSAAWIWALTGNAPRAQRALLAAERGSFDGPPPDGSASLASGISIIRAALAPLGVDRMLVDAQHAVESEPPGGPWHALAAALLGVAHLLHGSQEAASKALERAAHFGRESQPSAASFALGELSLLAAEQDDWATAEASAEESVQLVEGARLQGYMSSVLTNVARAKVAVHRADLSSARGHVAEAMRLYTVPSPGAFPWLAAQVAIALGHIFLDLDDIDAARLKSGEARRHLSRLLTEGTLREQQRQLAAEVARRSDQPHPLSAMAFTSAELRVLALLPTHLTLGEIADELHIARNTVKTHVAAVYRKLNASTRTAAVREGRTLGLLD